MLALPSRAGYPRQCRGLISRHTSPDKSGFDCHFSPLIVFKYDGLPSPGVPAVSPTFGVGRHTSKPILSGTIRPRFIGAAGTIKRRFIGMRLQSAFARAPIHRDFGGVSSAEALSFLPPRLGSGQALWHILQHGALAILVGLESILAAWRKGGPA